MKNISCILTVGISASGKSTWARSFCASKKNNALNINRDDIRFAITGHDNWGGYKFSNEVEDIVTRTQFSIAESAISLGKNIVISDTNLSETTRKQWSNFCERKGIRYEEKIFHISYEEAIRRDALRSNGVGHNVIWKQFVKFNEQFGERYTPNPSLPKAVLVDIDGTIADMKGIRGAFEWDKVKFDRPRQLIIRMVQALSNSGHEIIFMSGRDCCCYNDTLEWIHTHYGHDFAHLYMREEGDSRKDTVVKKEMFKMYIQDQYNVVMCIDDRPCVVRMYQALGIENVISVADQNIEF